MTLEVALGDIEVGGEGQDFCRFPQLLVPAPTQTIPVFPFASLTFAIFYPRAQPGLQSYCAPLTDHGINAAIT